ncbi:MAG: hypothetical protein AAGC55_01155, partial [Myxococcota bacterium]
RPATYHSLSCRGPLRRPLRCQALTASSGTGDGHSTLLITGDLYLDIQIVAAQQWKTVVPFNADSAIGSPHRVINTEFIEFARIFNAVQVGVIQRQPAAVILVDQGECRAGYPRMRRDIEAAGEAAYQQSFACAKIADQGDQITAL